MSLATRNYQRLTEVIVILLIVSLPFSVKMSNALIVIWSLLTVFKHFYQKRTPLRLDLLSITLLCYYIIEVIGLVFTDDDNLGYGLQILERHIGFVLVPICFMNLIIDYKVKNYLLMGFIGACFVATLICVVGSIKSSLLIYNQFFNDWMFSHDRFADHIGLQPVYFAMYLSFANLIIIDTLLNEWSRFSRLKIWALVILSVYFLAIIITLGGRTIIVMIMTIIMLMVFIHGYRKKSLKVLAMASLVPIIVTSFVFFQPTIRIRFADMLKSNYKETNYGSYFARLNIWTPGVEVIKENFWVGVGTGDYQKELDKKFIKYNYTEGVNTYNMHNQYLQTFLSYGVIGFGILLLNLMVQIRRAYQDKNLLYFCFLLLFMGAALTESMLNRNKGILFFLIFSFVFYKSEMISKREDLAV